MEIWIQKKGHGRKDSLHSLCKDRESSDENSSKSKLKKLVKRANSRQAKFANIIQSPVSDVFLKDLFFLCVHGLDYRIPKHMVSLDEKYLRCCLELVHISALKAAQYSMPVSLRATNMGTSSKSLITAGDECGSSQFVFECPVVAMTETVVLSIDAADQWTLGTVMGCKSMINILNSPLFQQFGASDINGNLNRMNFTDAKDLMCYDFMDSPSGLSICSSYKLEKETPMVKSHKHSSISVHKRLASTSSTTFTSSDWSSPSSSLSQGMLHCSWRQGIPHFVFSADDQKEVYEAKLRKVDPTDNKALDYVYLFHFNKRGQKGNEIPDSNLQLVGKMNVSTSFTLCPNNYRIMETEFILFSNIEICDKEMYISSHSHRKNKGLSKKMSQVFRISPSSKLRELSKLGGSSAIVESSPREPHGLGGTNILDTNVPPNFELAAIVLKDHLPCNQPDKVGGWGLKFLNKSIVNQTALPSESCSQNTGDCSTSMSILIPAGLHGGPRTINGGPSSLIDRWKSGGCCDCGGWDEGCPLTILQKRSSKAEVLSQVNMQGECKSIDIATQGSNDSSPTLRMVNVHDDLYFIHFQPSLSALQSFSIAVAIIHAQGPTLRPNIAREL